MDNSNTHLIENILVSLTRDLDDRTLDIIKTLVDGEIENRKNLKYILGLLSDGRN